MSTGQEKKRQKTGSFCRLSVKDAGLVSALASGMTRKAAAEALGISVRAVYRRQESPLFQSALAEIRAEAFTAAASRLASLADKATSHLEKLMDQTESKMVCLLACRAVLEIGIKFKETLEIMQRLTALEAKILERTSL